MFRLNMAVFEALSPSGGICIPCSLLASIYGDDSNARIGDSRGAFGGPHGECSRGFSPAGAIQQQDFYRSPETVPNLRYIVIAKSRSAIPVAALTSFCNPLTTPTTRPTIRIREFRTHPDRWKPQRIKSRGAGNFRKRNSLCRSGPQ